MADLPLSWKRKQRLHPPQLSQEQHQQPLQLQRPPQQKHPAPPSRAVRAMRAACSAIPRDWPRILDLARRHGPALLTANVPAGSPLHCACIDDKPGYAALLLAIGADPAAQDRDGMTALHTAAELGRFDIVHMLLRAGANVDGYCSHGYRGTRTSPLALATAGQHIHVVKLLLRYRANCHMRDRAGRTPIAIARNILDREFRHGQSESASAGKINPLFSRRSSALALGYRGIQPNGFCYEGEDGDVDVDGYDDGFDDDFDDDHDDDGDDDDAVVVEGSAYGLGKGRNIFSVGDDDEAAEVSRAVMDTVTLTTSSTDESF